MYLMHMAARMFMDAGRGRVGWGREWCFHCQYCDHACMRGVLRGGSNSANPMWMLLIVVCCWVWRDGTPLCEVGNSLVPARGGC